ncbi:ABC transporter substrate-binding protein [Pseudochrobactrum sp. MP213Fo]|uniref:ABC transporter substrate-binding protein n=1 Tax=Pseudochrobactrum sp. MP213Fo TaxID=3022250 RepID=UPI003BA39B2F
MSLLKMHSQIFSATLLSALLLSTLDSSAEEPKICVNQYSTVTVIDDIVTGFKQGLERNQISAKNLVIQNPEGDPATLQIVAQGFVSDECDVIFAITTPGAQIFRKLTKTIPIIFAGSATPAEGGVVNSMAKPGENITGIANPAPVEADIDAMISVLPQLKTVGIIYKAGDPAGDYLAKRALNHMEKRGLTPVIAAIANTGEAIQAAQSLIGRVDAVLLPGDPATMSAIPGIYKITNEAKIPMFGSLNEAVSKGAILSGSYDFVQIGNLAADLVRKVLDGENPGDIPVIVPDTSGFSINVTQADRLGLKIPDALLKKATHTY